MMPQFAVGSPLLESVWAGGVFIVSGSGGVPDVPVPTSFNAAGNPDQNVSVYTYKFANVKRIIAG